MAREDHGPVPGGGQLGLTPAYGIPLRISDRIASKYWRLPRCRVHAHPVLLVGAVRRWHRPALRFRTAGTEAEGSCIGFDQTADWL